MEGNVGGGREFRGSLPYYSRSEMSLGALSPTDSFIRRSSGTGYEYDRQPGQVQPYYLPQRLVSSGMGSAASLSRAGQLESATGGLKSTSVNRAIEGGVEGLGIYQPRSTLSMSVEELDRLSGRSALRESLDIDGSIKGMDWTEKAGRQAYTESTDVKKAETTRLLDESLQPVKPLEPEVSLSAESQAMKDLLEKEQEIHEEIREASRKPRGLDAPDELKAAEPEEKTTDKQDVNVKVGTETSEEPQSDGGYSVSDVLLPGETMRQRAAAVLGEHKTLEELSEAKHNEFVAKGDVLLKEGKFYKAISQYVLAGVWKSDSAELNLHRSIAHFGAGEYMSSSLYLRRAIVLGVDKPADKSEWARLLNNISLIESRLKEAGEWQEKGGSGEMAFLLAYVHYTEGSMAEAEKYISTAEEKLPGDEAAAILKKAISNKW
jgi:tetratricopeptide (TPR) repeat protein